MNEYRAESGGRYTFVEDFLNLQDIALSYSGMFGNSNFVLSGCEFKDTEVTPGIVVMDGKLRKFNGAYINADTNTLFIKPTHSTANTPYATGVSKLGIEEFGCEASLTRPSTGSVIQISRGSATGYADEEFWGRKMLLLESEKGSQTVSGDVSVTGTFKPKVLKIGEYDALTASQDESGRVVMRKEGVKVVFGEESLTLYIKDEALMKLEDGAVTIKGSGMAAFSNIESVNLATASINSNLAESRTLEINVGRRTLGTATDTVIGDGKGDTLLEVNGTDRIVTVYGDGLMIGKASFDDCGTTYFIKRGEDGGYLPISTLYRISDVPSQQGVVGGVTFNIVTRNTGFRTGTYAEYSVFAPAIQFTGDTVNFDAKLYDRGMLFENKYAQISAGLSQFIIDGVTKADLRKQIGAASDDTEVFSEKIQKIEDYLEKEVANSKDGFENLTQSIRPEELRKQIGAASQDSVKTIWDSGWQETDERENSYVRYLNGCIYFRYNHAGATYDAEKVILFDELTAIPTIKEDCSQYVMGSKGTMYKVTLKAKSRKVILSCLQQAASTAGEFLAFTCIFI